MEKTVLITGASRGIGRQTALAFARSGYDVVINYHNSQAEADRLEREIRSFGAGVLSIRADVSQRPQGEEMVRRASEVFGGIDILVNNAGIAQQKLFSDLTCDDWNRMLDVNVTGMFHCCQCVLPHMLHKKSGKIINISSMWGVVGASCEVHYSAAKAAVIGLTKALAKELGPSGIRVNCVAPGVIGTDMISDLDGEAIAELKEQTPLGAVGRPGDIAGTVLFLASDAADFITGQVIGVNGGFII